MRSRGYASSAMRASPGDCRTPKDIGSCHAAIIAEHHQLQKLLAQCRRLGGAASGERGCGTVQHDEVSFQARCKPSDAILEVQRLRAAERREIEGTQRRQSLTLQLRDLVRLAHR